MNEAQVKAWEAAQALPISVDLVAAANEELRMLGEVDRLQCLYEGPAVKRAIDRCVLYLLNATSPVFQFLGSIWNTGSFFCLNASVHRIGAVIGNAHRLICSRICCRALCRYERFWLPLLAREGDENLLPLIPPLDCAWIWHVHRLNPVSISPLFLL